MKGYISISNAPTFERGDVAMDHKTIAAGEIIVRVAKWHLRLHA